MSPFISSQAIQSQVLKDISDTPEIGTLSCDDDRASALGVYCCRISLPPTESEAQKVMSRIILYWTVTYKFGSLPLPPTSLAQSKWDTFDLWNPAYHVALNLPELQPKQ